MMDSPPELSLPPEPKSLLDPSELVVHASSPGRDIVLITPQSKLIFLIRTRGRGEPRERRTGRLAEHCCILHVCLGSLRASRGALKWAESSGGVGIVSTVVPVGTFSRPF